MSRFAIIEAPSILGLSPGGVEKLPRALLDAGLQDSLAARHAGLVEPASYDPSRDPETLVLNPQGIRQYAHDLAAAVERVLVTGEKPLILGGDCSILLGSLLALRRRSRYGLLFLDGHADFYQPEAEPNGEAASMDLALATGHGPGILTTFDGLCPLVHAEDVVAFGRRDREEADAAGSQRIEESGVRLIELEAIRAGGVGRCLARAIESLTRPGLDGFFVHLDCDVLDDAIMPAVDYRLEGGLSWDELGTVLSTAAHTPGFVGIEITIFNPTLDVTGKLAGRLAACLAASLS